jgi:hypothetical protein
LPGHPTKNANSLPELGLQLLQVARPGFLESNLLIVILSTAAKNAVENKILGKQEYNSSWTRCKYEERSKIKCKKKKEVCQES